MPVDYFAIIHKYIPPETALYRLYVPHVAMVTAKALRIARRLGLSREQERFIEEAAMLHDIGIITTHDDLLGTTGPHPYIMHIVEGRRILEAEGLPRHALVAERHIGVGISAEEVRTQGLPLPVRDYMPQTVEEKIISYADLFFSKHPDHLWHEKPLDAVRRTVARYGARAQAQFEAWVQRFEPEEAR